MSPGVIGNDVPATAFRGKMEASPGSSGGSSGAILAAMDMGAVRGPANERAGDYGLNLQLQAVGKIHSQKASLECVRS